MRSITAHFTTFLSPKSRRGFHLALELISFLMVLSLMSTFVGAQIPVPTTVALKPAYVGGKYEVQLANLLPVGTSPVTWRFVNNGTAPDATVLQKPAGIGLQDINVSGIIVGQKLVVAPDAAAVKRDTAGKPTLEPYIFELQGTDGGNQVTIRFSLVVKPFGVDESRLRLLSGSVASFDPAHEKPAPGVASPPSPAFVLTTSTADEETIVLDQEFRSPKPKPPVAGPDLSPENQSRVLELVERTVGTHKRVNETTVVEAQQTITTATNFQAGDYLLVHIIVWKTASADAKAEARREIWSLFKAKDSGDTQDQWEPQADPTDKNVFNSRIFGGKRVAVLLIHLNTPAAWDVKYKVELNQRIPTPIQNLITLAGKLGASGGSGEAAIAPSPKDIWGARMMLVRYAASDMLVKVNTITSNDSQVEQSKDYSKKYLNEGRYHWDVSVGVPLKSIREVEFKTDANNRVTTAAKERESVYGFLNIFPKKVDLLSESFLTLPHFVFGVPLASKPLHHPFAGLGYGIYKTPIKFNLFAGVVFNRERVPQTLAVGSPATSDQLDSDLRTRWVRKFMFGINFPISQIKDALKK